MATQTLTITDQNIGDALPFPNGFVTDLSMITPPTAREQPQWDEGRGVWKAGRFVLRGSAMFRDLVCIDPHNDGGWASGFGSTALVVVNGSIGFHGDLTVVACPRGSIWSITLSDVPNYRPPRSASINFSGANYTPHHPPAGPKPTNAPSVPLGEGWRDQPALIER